MKQWKGASEKDVGRAAKDRGCYPAAELLDKPVLEGVERDRNQHAPLRKPTPMVRLETTALQLLAEWGGARHRGEAVERRRQRLGDGSQLVVHLGKCRCEA